MDSNVSWLSVLEAKATETAASIMTVFPGLLGGIVVLGVGWLLARLVRSLVRRLSNGANRLLERVFRKGDLANIRLSAPAVSVVAEVAFWIIVLLTITVAARIAGFTAIFGWMNQLVSHLPNLVVGIFIITLGYLASRYTGKRVAAGANGKKTGENIFLARLAQGFIFITALIIGLDQFGVKVSFLITLLTVAAGALLAGFSIAFGFGAKSHVQNLIGARTAQHALQPGLKVRIGDMEGEILEVTSSHIAVDTATGHSLIPARIIDNQAIEILTSAEESNNG